MNIQEQATWIAGSLQNGSNAKLTVNFHTVTSCLHFQRVAGRVFLSGRQLGLQTKAHSSRYAGPVLWAPYLFDYFKDSCAVGTGLIAWNHFVS